MNIHGERLLLERYAFGELNETERKQIGKHLEQCDECASAVNKLHTERSEFLERHPFAAFTGAHAPVVSLPWYRNVLTCIGKPALVPVYSLLLIACIALPLVLREYHSNEGGYGFKGKNPVFFDYRRNGKVRKGSSAIAYHAGDQIQIAFSTEKKQHVSLLSIDSKGTISFYHPDASSSDCTVEIPAGEKQAFPGSIILDTTKGHELIIVLFSERALPKDDVKSWAASLYASYQTPEKINNVLQASSEGMAASVSTVLLTKE
jgi:hypothetical protein